MPGFFGLLNRFSPEGAAAGGAQRANERRQRMDEASVSLADVRADALARERAERPSQPIHPGEVLMQEFMKPLGLKSPTAAKAMGVPRTRIERLVAGVTPVTPDTALRLDRAFGRPAIFWLNLQAAYDLEMTEPALGQALNAVRRLAVAPA
jgi:addiction module HigA family antidote